jgi:hypothetical protein
MTAFRIILALVFLLGTLSSFGQNSSNGSIYYQDESVVIRVSETQCDDAANGISKVYLFLDIENISGEEIEFSCKKEFWYDGECSNCASDSDEHRIEIKLSEGETRLGSCNEKNRLRIFVKMTDLKNVRELTRFDLKDININKL